MNRKKLSLITIALVVVILIILLICLVFFRSYDVVFDSKGGTSVAAEKVISGNMVGEPETPVLADYIFEGWYLNGVKFDFSTKITEDITLTGKWKSIIIEVE